MGFLDVNNSSAVSTTDMNSWVEEGVIKYLGVSDNVEQEIAEGGRFQLERCFKKNVKRASEKTKRNLNWRKDEVVELWVLVNK